MIYLIAFLLLIVGVAACVYAKRQETRARIAESELGKVSAALETLKGCYDDMNRIAGEAVKAAHEKHFPATTKYGNINYPIPARTPNFITVDCLNCSAPVGRVREEFPVNCPVCGTEVDPVLDSGEIE